MEGGERHIKFSIQSPFEMCGSSIVSCSRLVSYKYSSLCVKRCFFIRCVFKQHVLKRKKLAWNKLRNATKHFKYYTISERINNHHKFFARPCINRRIQSPLSLCEYSVDPCKALQEIINYPQKEKKNNYRQQLKGGYPEPCLFVRSGMTILNKIPLFQDNSSISRSE